MYDPELVSCCYELCRTGFIGSDAASSGVRLVAASAVDSH